METSTPKADKYHDNVEEVRETIYVVVNNAHTIFILRTYYHFIVSIVQIIMKEDKENETPLSTISLEFSKKSKIGPISDRSPSLQGSGVKVASGNQSLSLLEKKKQYSMAIREKNLAKKKRDQSQQAKSSGKILTPIPKENNNEHYNSLREGKEIPKKNSQATIKLTIDKQLKENNPLKSSQKSQTKEKEKVKQSVRDSKRDKSKLQRLQTTEQMEGHFNSNISLLSQNNFVSTTQPMNIDLSVIKLNDLSRIERKISLEIVSKEVNQNIIPSEEDKKEIQVLKKYNATFKKELANFRKENGSSKKQIEALKKQLSVLTQRNNFLEEQNVDHLKLLELLQSKNVNNPPVPSPQSIKSTRDSKTSKFSPSNDQKLKQILNSYENDLFEATSLNKKLEFRNYMLQKRLADEAEIHRKQMAKEIATWKERYIRARNENLRMKDSRGQVLLEMSISRQE